MGVSPTVERPATRQGGRDLVEWRRRQARREVRREFGRRIQWEAVFFGLLAAIGLAASLVAMVLGGLVAAGVTSFREDAGSLVDHVMVAGGVIPVAILALSYLAGGYVAARMARFDGLRQGLGIWLLSVLMGIAVAIAAWIAGGQLDPVKSITLPSNPIASGPLSQSGWAILAAALAVSLACALVGAALGERFHRTVDRVTDEFEAVPGALPEEPSFEEETIAEDSNRPGPDTETESDLDAQSWYGPRRESTEEAASAAARSEESTASPAARP